MKLFGKKCGAPRGTILKNRINHLITPVQAIGHETPDLETHFSNSSEIRQQKWWIFERNWQLVIWYASRLATALSLPKPFRWPKTQVHKIVIFENHPDWCLGDMLTKITHFSKTLLNHNPLFGQKWYKQFRTKRPTFQNNPHMRKDASSWKAIYDMRRCPE